MFAIDLFPGAESEGAAGIGVETLPESEIDFFVAAGITTVLAE